MICLPRKPKPLAEALRPAALDEVIGQQHLIGPGKPLRLAVESGTLHSMILWGPPGVGKPRWRVFWQAVSMPNSSAVGSFSG
jgi:replication-associated recombination protein RarA